MQRHGAVIRLRDQLVAVATHIVADGLERQIHFGYAELSELALDVGVTLGLLGRLAGSASFLDQLVDAPFEAFSFLALLRKLTVQDRLGRIALRPLALLKMRKRLADW